MQQIKVALAGNPNVGKSTVFNALTHLHQHTGNWPGKTVANATGEFLYKNAQITLVDLPGTYSLRCGSVEEEIARDYICSGDADLVICVADATCLSRNLNLVLQILEMTDQVVLCVNLLDEAKKKGVTVNLERLSHMLSIPVIGTSARNGAGLDQLKETIYSYVKTGEMPPLVDSLSAEEKTPPEKYNQEQLSMEKIIEQSNFIYQCCVHNSTEDPHTLDRKLDRIFTSKLFGYPIMISFLCLIFWLTITGANYPSTLLSQFFQSLEPELTNILLFCHAPQFLRELLMEGLYKTLSWVIAVMLPPMAIFFPIFTLLEDSGYLPRIAFNLDHCFQRACAHGKQALTMCMGFGCNACGVTGCRIIESPRERLIAILTNTLVPCNGKFATLIAMVTMFFAGSAATAPNLIGQIRATVILTMLILFGVLVTLLVSKFLSSTILKGLPSSFTLELPPYRRPQIGKVILRSVLDRTLFILGRAIIVAAPAGILIWLLANTYVNGDASLLFLLTEFLDPLGKIMGLDGIILAGFLLGFPANEIVIPIILMAYLSTGSLIELGDLTQFHALLIDHGWTSVTALCFLLFSIVHFPCGTTCFTIYKETKSWKWTSVSILLPTLLGIGICILVNGISILFL